MGNCVKRVYESRPTRTTLESLQVQVRSRNYGTVNRKRDPIRVDVGQREN